MRTYLATCERSEPVGASRCGRAHFGLSAADTLTVAAALIGQVHYAATADRAWAAKLTALADRITLVCLE